MPKNRLQPQFFSFLSLILGFVVSISILIALYIILRAFGIEERMNAIDRNALVSWRKQEFNPKRFFKFFYNTSILYIPFATLFFSRILERTQRVKRVKFPKLNFPNLSLSRRFLSRRFIEETRILEFLEKYHIAIVVVMLFFTLWNFGYLLETGIWINYYHHNFIIATINDLFAGKHLLIDTFSQYGMLLPGTLYLIFRLGIVFSYMNLYLLFMIFTVIYFGILYCFLLSLTNNKLYALFGLFFIIAVNALLNYPTYPVSENYVWPGSTVLRYFLDIPVFYLLYKNRNLDSKPMLFVTSVLVAFAVLYNLETGLALFFGFVFLIFFALLTKKNLTPTQKAKFFLLHITPLVVCLIVFFLLFSVYTYVVVGQLPHWDLFVKFVGLAQEGISNIDTPLFGWHLFYLGLYFSTIIYFLNKTINTIGRIQWKWTFIAGMAMYGLFLMNYYISRSVSSNLTVVSIPAGVILIVIIHELSKKKDTISRYVYQCGITIIAIVSILGCYYLVKRIQYRWYALTEIQRLHKYPGNRGFIVIPYNEEGFITAKNLFTSIRAIKQLTEDEKRILLFSRYDGVILVMSEKTHVLPLPLLEQIYYKNELERYKKILVGMKEKPTYLFVDKKNSENPPPTSYAGAEELFESIKQFYIFYKHVGILDVYRLKTIRELSVISFEDLSMLYRTVQSSRLTGDYTTSL